MTRLSLPQVTLCAADTRAPALAAQSLLRSMAGIDYGRVVLFTHGWSPPQPLPGIEIVEIASLQSASDYSRFVLRALSGHVRTSHVLVTQWDGFVVDPGAWTDEFLAYDYVGAVWPEQPEARSVGNGGFSLRSRRLLAAGLDPGVTGTHPEDEVLCRTHRALLESQHGVLWAPPALARRFSYENEAPAGRTFGFHGPYRLPRHLDEATIGAMLDQLPDAFFSGRDGRRLARALLGHGMATTARQALKRRLAAGRRDPHTRMLDVAASMLTRMRRP